ncbi:hypothetical protein TWF694_006490 [Orbilia ellipsospora]|uniref:DUF7029 domain-containing protein n=1 Tax=Orbilia ellipsospora TaxID=2528407 RepID=A0AAV9XNP4_9PEZI
MFSLPLLSLVSALQVLSASAEFQQFSPYSGDNFMDNFAGYTGNPPGSHQALKTRDTDPINLLPIREEHLYPRMQKRSDDLSRLHLQDSVTLLFGKRASTDQIHLANVTAINPNPKHPVITLEKFDSLTKGIRCAGDTLILQFTSKDVMEYAIKQWDWVNQDSKDYFYLISQHHHSDCNPVDERKPHKVTAVKYDFKKHIAVLTLGATSWSETLGSFEFGFDTVDHKFEPSQQQTHEPVVKRGGESVTSVLDFPKLVLKHYCDGAGSLSWFIPACDRMNLFNLPYLLDAASSAAIEKAWDVIPEFDGGKESTDINWGKPGSKERVKLIGSDSAIKNGEVGKVAPQITTEINCVGCYLQGNVQFSAFGSKNEKGAMNLMVAFKPKLKGKLEIEFSGKVAIAKEFNLLEMFIWEALQAKVIKDIVALKPQFLNGPGVAMSAGVEGNFTLGFEMDTGADSSLILTGSHEKGLRAGGEGWDKLTASPVLHVSNLKATSEISPYFRFGIGIGADFFKGSAVTASVGFWGGLTPNFASTLTRGFDEKGVCGGKPEIGAKLETKFKVDLGYKTKAELKTKSDLINFLLSMIPRPQFLEDIGKTLNKDKSESLFEKGFSVCHAFEV